MVQKSCKFGEHCLYKNIDNGDNTSELMKKIVDGGSSSAGSSVSRSERWSPSFIKVCFSPFGGGADAMISIQAADDFLTEAKGQLSETLQAAIIWHAVCKARRNCISRD